MTMEEAVQEKAREAGLPRIRRSQFEVERVRSFLEDHLGCTQKEVTHYTGLPYDRVRRAMAILRSEWQTRERRKKFSQGENDA